MDELQTKASQTQAGDQIYSVVLFRALFTT